MHIYHILKIKWIYKMHQTFCFTLYSPFAQKYGIMILYMY